MKFARGSPSRFFESLTVSGLNARTPERAQAAKLIGRSGRHQLKNLVRLGGCEKRGAQAVGIRSSNPGKRQVRLIARVKARVRPAVEAELVLSKIVLTGAFSQSTGAKANPVFVMMTFSVCSNLDIVYSSPLIFALFANILQRAFTCKNQIRCSC